MQEAKDLQVPLNVRSSLFHLANGFLWPRSLSLGYFGHISGFQGQVQLVPDDVICVLLLLCFYYAHLLLRILLFRSQLTYGSKFCFFAWPSLLPTFLSLWTSSLLLLCLDFLFPPNQLYHFTGTAVAHHFQPYPISLVSIRSPFSLS